MSDVSSLHGSSVPTEHQSIYAIQSLHVACVPLCIPIFKSSLHVQ